MFQLHQIAAGLLLIGSLTGAVACSHDAPRADEALIIPPGTTSGGTGMGGVEAPAPRGRDGTRSISLGAIEDPSAGGDSASATSTSTSAGPGTTVTISSTQSPPRTAAYSTMGYPGAPIANGTAPNTVGTVNGDYGPMPLSGDAVPAANYGTPGGVITH